VHAPAFSTTVEKLGEITEREFRGYWDQTIADAGDTEATLQAMAAEILRYRHVGHVRFPPDCVARSFRNARLLLLGHMPDHNVVMRHVRSGVTPIEVEADVVDWSGEPWRV